MMTSLPGGAVEAFWAEFVAATGTDASYTAWAFGADDDSDQQTQLGRLVLEGSKRATTGRLADYENEALPQPGDYSIILDGARMPLCIIETTRIEVRRLDDVDDDFAWAEGEGDRSLAWWREAHLGFFERAGTPIDGDTPLLLEWFDVVWPPARPSAWS